MAQSCDSDKSEYDAVWSDEQDRIPLKQRLKLLLASKRLSDFSGSNPKNATPKSEIVGKKEDKHSDLQVDFANIVGEGRAERLSLQQSFDDEVGECGSQGTKGCNGTHFNQTTSPEINIISMKEETGVNDGFSYQNSMPRDYYVKVKTLCTDYCSTSPTQNCVNGSSVISVPPVKIKTEFFDDFVEDLDHIILKDRQTMLLSRKLLESKKLVSEADSMKLSGPVSDDGAQCSVNVGKEDSLSCEKQSIMTGSYDIALCKNPESGSTKVSSVESSSGTCMVLALEKQQTELSNLLNTQERETPNNHDSCSMQARIPHNNNTVLGLDSSPLVAIKAEPIDNIDIPGRNENFSDVSVGNLVPVKWEVDISIESYWDKLDHMLLHERMKLLAPSGIPSVNIHEEFECLGKTVPSSLDCRPIQSEHSKPLKVGRPRKRRKTVTDSVETALEEDAPALLRVLIENGVLVNEIKLYGEIESNDALDESLVEDSFTKLEAVISKLFCQRPSLLKLAPLSCTKGEKASYCLGCLISLVEQARYLQSRKWPVEWGWCRDLQSFIFVFERHNRIVLERPEYGYATFFFELVDSLPIDWQIKRLVTAMKLTSCSRATLIENKTLMIGEDLTEGEARVLMEYGWMPNSGLGTMLNYCDRVVHDRKSEKDSSEWRSKIGKLLADGYNGGTIVSTHIPRKVIEYGVAQGSQVKLEL